jgi:son of sevenless-like protein
MPINHLPPQAQTVPAPLPLVATPIPERPWYLGEDYDPSEIVFDDRGVVKAGTLKALVARLTPHGSTGMFLLVRIQPADLHVF